MKRIIEVSNINFDEKSKINTYRESRYNLMEDGSKDVKGFFETDLIVWADQEGTKPVEDRLTPDEVVAYVKTRKIDEEIDEVIYSESQTTENTPATSEQATSGVAGASATIEEASKIYAGKKIISESFRLVNEKQYRHIKLEDGSTYDLTEGDYQANVKIAE